MFAKDPIVVVPYRGFVSKTRLFLEGRVLEDEGILSAKGDARLKSLWNNIKRFESDEIAGAKVQITFEGREYNLTTDKEGYYTLDVAIPPWKGPGKRQRWQEAKIKLLSVPKRVIPPYETIGEVFAPGKNAAFGIISDIDDTVLQTFVSSILRLKMIYNSFFRNAHERYAMEGIIELYQKLEQGLKGNQENPFFYISDSPRNIYDSIVQFLTLQGLPKGPVFLKDYGWPLRSKNGPLKGHKLSSIERILGAFPDLPFIMLGDTASKDADFYLQMAKDFPGRVLSIYIRKTRNNRNARRIERLVEGITDIDIHIIRSSSEILKHALQKGYVIS